MWILLIGSLAVVFLTATRLLRDLAATEVEAENEMFSDSVIPDPPKSGPGGEVFIHGA